jgi:hypothetical protein
MRSFYLSLQTFSVVACLGFAVACMASLLDGQISMAMLDLGGFLASFFIYSITGKAY